MQNHDVKPTRSETQDNRISQSTSQNLDKTISIIQIEIGIAIEIESAGEQNNSMSIPIKI
jgi:hypothetical protein